MIVLLFVIVAPILFYILYRIKNKRFYELAAAVPALNGELPLIGDAHMCFNINGAELAELGNKIVNECFDKGGVIKIWLGPVLNFTLTRAEDADFILKNHLEKLSDYDIFQDIIGLSVLNAPVAIWKGHRKIVMSAFTSKMIYSYFPTFVAKSRKLAEKLDEQAIAGEIDLFPYLGTYTLDTVCETTYGVRVNSQDDPNHPFLVQLDIMMGIVTDRLFNHWQRINWLFKLTPKYSTYCRARNTLHDFILEIIRTKREELRDKRKRNAVGTLIDASASEIPSFLELVLNMEDAGYSDKELMYELLTVTLGGTDTTALTLSYTFSLLAKYPKIQERVYEEIKEVLGDSDRPLEKDDLPKLQYMERVMKESLRLYPPVGMVGRKLLEEIKLPSGYTLPAGAGVIVSLLGLQRSPEYWGPDAKEFNPDRFLPERLKLVHPCCYIPFSFGPRNCPGYHFGNIALKFAITEVIRNFKLIATPEKTAVPNIKVKYELMVKPVKAVRLTLKRRH